MIKHIVLIRARPDVAITELQGIFTELAALRGRLPGPRSVAFGRSDSPEN
jgi:Stress responsive A/B Barrel Domain